MADNNRKEGFWYSPANPKLPKPVSHEKPVKNKAKVVARMKTVAANFSGGMQKGVSTCRICKERNGSHDVSYNGFTWPIGYIHYVEKHNVHPTKEFLEALFSGSLQGKRPKKINPKNQQSKISMQDSVLAQNLLKHEKSIVQSYTNIVAEMSKLQSLLALMSGEPILQKKNAGKKKVVRLMKTKK